MRFAGVRHPEDRDDHIVHSVGACFADVDAETRRAVEQRQALSEALAEAEQANRAKTAFLSNMSHEIRTAMNAIIGLDSIALNEPDVPERLQDYLTKIGSSAQGQRADLKGRRVLLAEDMPVNSEIMRMVLGMREIETDLAENGLIAVEMFASHPAGTYDAILMDMRMPEMDGLEATRRIRAMDREDARTVPIIALTAYAFDEDVQQSMQAGLNAHLSKPVDPAVLFETLESLIRA